MTALQIIQILSVIESLIPVLVSAGQGIKELTDHDVDLETMAINDLVALKQRLESTSSDTWPEFQFTLFED